MARDSIPAPASTAWRHTIALLGRLLPPPRSFAVRLWDGIALPAAAGSPFMLVLNHPSTLRRMFASPIQRSLGEAFILSYDPGRAQRDRRDSAQRHCGQ